MSFKYTLILLLGSCCSVFCVITEEEQEKWFKDLEEQHWEQCGRYISEDSLQQLRDDFEADNEEIRNFRLCMSIERGYFSNSQIIIDAVMDDYQNYSLVSDDTEKKHAKKILNICKDEGEQEENDIDILGKFFTCVIDRVKSAA